MDLRDLEKEEWGLTLPAVGWSCGMSQLLLCAFRISRETIPLLKGAFWLLWSWAHLPELTDSALHGSCDLSLDLRSLFHPKGFCEQ